jgi:hypothetical protein
VAAGGAEYTRVSPKRGASRRGDWTRARGDVQSLRIDSQ